MSRLPRGSIWAVLSIAAFFLICLAVMAIGAWRYARL